MHVVVPVRDTAARRCARRAAGRSREHAVMRINAGILNQTIRLITLCLLVRQCKDQRNVVLRQIRLTDLEINIYLKSRIVTDPESWSSLELYDKLCLLMTGAAYVSPSNPQPHESVRARIDGIHVHSERWNK